MSTTAKQDRNFIDDVIPGSILEDAISWIGNNMSPEDVFSKSDLASWAEDNLKELSESELTNWAESNGYVKE